MIWPNLNWPHFTRTECAAISRGHGRLVGAPGSDPVRRGCDQLISAHSVQRTDWGQLRQGQTGDMKLNTPPELTTRSRRRQCEPANGWSALGLKTAAGCVTVPCIGNVVIPAVGDRTVGVAAAAAAAAAAWNVPGNSRAPTTTTITH